MRSLCAALLGLGLLAACKDKPTTGWVDPQSLQQGPVRQALTPAQRDRIRKLQQTFAEVDSTPLEKWFEDFRRDQNPDRELAIYEGMAEAFEAYCTGRALTQAAKSDVYSIVLLRSGASDDQVLPRLKLTELSIDDAKAVLRLYKVPPAPITVTDVPP